MVLHQLRKFDGRTVTSAETYLSTSQEVDVASDDTAGKDTVIHCNFSCNVLCVSGLGCFYLTSNQGN